MTPTQQLKPNLRALIADAEAAGLTVRYRYEGSIGIPPRIWNISIIDPRLRAPLSIDVNDRGSFQRATIGAGFREYKSVKTVRRVLCLPEATP